MKSITELTKKLASYPNQTGNLQAMQKAVAAGDIEEWLAIARGSHIWVEKCLGLTLKDFGDGPAKSCYGNGQVFEEYTLKDQVIHGSYAQYHYNGDFAEVGNFENGKPITPFYTYIYKYGKLVRYERTFN